MLTKAIFILLLITEILIGLWHFTSTFVVHCAEIQIKKAGYQQGLFWPFFFMFLHLRQKKKSSWDHWDIPSHSLSVSQPASPCSENREPPKALSKSFLVSSQLLLCASFRVHSLESHGLCLCINESWVEAQCSVEDVSSVWIQGLIYQVWKEENY